MSNVLKDLVQELIHISSDNLKAIDVKRAMDLETEYTEKLEAFILDVIGPNEDYTGLDRQITQNGLRAEQRKRLNGE